MLTDRCVYVHVLYTHVQSTSVTGVWPSHVLVTVANQSNTDASWSRLRRVEWMLHSQSSWTCQTCMDGGRHHLRCQLSTASKRSSWALSPIFPEADHSASIQNMSQHIFDCLADTRSLFLTNLTLIKQQIDSDNHATLIFKWFLWCNINQKRVFCFVFTSFVYKCYH